MMEGKEGGGFQLGKKSSLSKEKGGEVDYRTKSGTAWSHNFLNQKPWHPLSYQNMRRKWIAEQTHANKERRGDEVAREYAQEQEFFRQTALISKKEKEKLEMMKAVSFMYVKPPGYNAESAKAAEVADEQKTQEQERDIDGSNEPSHDGTSTSKKTETEPPLGEKKKSRKKDIYGRALPTEEEFEVLKNAPRLDTGLDARAKPFGIEIRNVKCLRCGKFGHQSGDRECPLRDTIMPNEENRLKRDDPLTAILAQTEPAEPLKWELKQKPGMSPPRGGCSVDDPNQQIVADETIFDEYGGFLSEANIPELLANFSSSKSTKKRKSSKKRKHRKRSSLPECSGTRDEEDSGSDEKRRRVKRKSKRKKLKYSESSSSESSSDSDRRRHREKSNRHKRHRHSNSSDSDTDERSRRNSVRRHRHHDHRRH